MISLKTKFEGVYSIVVFNLCWGDLELCQTVATALYIFLYDVTHTPDRQNQSLLYLQHGVSHPLSDAVAYSNRLDRTTATLRLPATDAIQLNNAQWRADNGKMIVK